MNTSDGPTTTVMLLRHAHAAWARPGQRDFDRPLDRRGREDIRLIGQTMAGENLLPDIILCSPAKRCMETIDIVAASLPEEPEMIHDDDLYTRGHEHYVDLLSQQEASVVLLCGHNPMMEDTARTLTTSAEDWAGRRLEKGFPTAGLAIIDIPGAPRNLSQGGHLRRFLTPKRLRKTEAGEI